MLVHPYPRLWIVLTGMVLLGGAPPPSPSNAGEPSPGTAGASGAAASSAAPAPPAPTASVVAAPRAPALSEGAARQGPAAANSASRSPGGPSRTTPATASSSPTPAATPSPARAWRESELQSAVDELQRWARAHHADLGAEIRDVTSERLLGAAAATRPLNPASNQKILTVASLLKHLPVDTRFRTTLSGRREASRIASVVLHGGGDPSLAYADLTDLAARLEQAGVACVGDVHVDQSYFDSHFVPPAFEQQPNEWAAFRAPVSAASLERNAVTLHVEPVKSGSDARVGFEPPGFVEITGRVLVKDDERDQNVRLTLRSVGQHLRAQVAGWIGRAAHPFRWSRRVDDPSLYAGYALRAALLAAGIQVDGKVSDGAAAEGELLWAHDSRPLLELLPELGKQSDNFYAETLLKDLGAVVKGTPGTSAKGARVVLEDLAELGALDPGTRIQNGSGLFDANRVSPHSLVSTLLAMYQDPRLRGPFVEQLAVGGVDGTLENRFTRYRAARRIRAKTGTLHQIVALSGYVLAEDASGAVAFSLIVNGARASAWEVRRRIDTLVEAIARAQSASL